MFSNPTPTTLTLLLLITSISLLLLFFSPSLPNITNPNHSLYLSFTDNSSISNNLQILTTRPHIAGSLPNADAASYVLSTFKSYCPPHINSHIVSYQVSLTYPSSRTLTLIRPHPNPPTNFNLTQENYSKNPYAHEVGQTFHAYAKSGTAVGPVVYANYGSVEDFETLRRMGVDVSGTVVLARYGKIHRGGIVSNAYDEGASGVLVYTNRKDYGGPESFADNKWMPSSGVRVGTAYSGAGDPSTPGWASTSSCERRLNKELILRSLNGQVAYDDWKGISSALLYRVGPGPGILNLNYNGNYGISKIENVIAVIQGVEEPDRFVILGNHRDAWTFGAVDPNSRTAALLDVARRLGEMQKNGCRPRRTIILCNWDAEEYGLIGSTEWVEENREMLASRAVAYLNMDCAVSGPGFYASATPQLEGLLREVARQVQDPDNSSQTIYDSWTGSKGVPTFGRLGGGGSDYASFVQHVGVSDLDMLFGGGYPVYHSMYDDFTWMRKFGDPMFQRHTSTKELEVQIPGKSVSLLPLYRSIQELKKAAIKNNKQKKIYGSSKYNDYGSKSFPGIDDAIDKAKKALNSMESWRLVHHEMWRASRA
ncbi:hypothetical protein MKX01_035607 [Papaver californicum]|nr:hypothetical protein MKX01_035607 [Papaver californicum]